MSLWFILNNILGDLVVIVRSVLVTLLYTPLKFIINAVVILFLWNWFIGGYVISLPVNEGLFSKLGDISYTIPDMNVFLALGISFILVLVTFSSDRLPILLLDENVSVSAVIFYVLQPFYILILAYVFVLFFI
jgi:hypothetical protein